MIVLSILLMLEICLTINSYKILNKIRKPFTLKKPQFVQYFSKQNQNFQVEIIDYNKSFVAEIIDGWNSSSIDTFLKFYWQKKPLFVKNAFKKDYFKIFNINSTDLFQLATSDDVESRLLTRKGKKWIKEYGPFEINDLKLLHKKGNWTLLVQEVDRHLLKASNWWKESFNFIPKWRRDDIMISYATIDGGIGSHIDNYDVFLVQGK